MSWLSRFASPAFQRAHARVTAENARYIREALERDAENERLTQENKQLTQERDRYKEAAEELRRKHRQAMDISMDQAEELAVLRAQVKDLTEQLTEVTAERLACRSGLCEWSSDLRGQLNAAKAELARADRRWFGHIASCDRAAALDDFDHDQERSNSE
jgi:seryl-tRNA synthetase